MSELEDVMLSKICTKCGTEKGLAYFFRDRQKRDGLSCICKSCNSKHGKEYYTNNIEKAKIYDREYRISHKKQNSDYQFKYYLKNRIAVLNRSRIHHQNNQEIIQNRRLKNCYGINKEEYSKLFVSQNGVCAICGQKERVINKQTNKIKSLAVDHDHVTGRIRGLLCARCNTALGLLGDSLSLLTKAAEYLRENENGQ